MTTTPGPWHMGRRAAIRAGSGAALAAFLAGCGDGDDGDATTPGAGTSGPDDPADTAGAATEPGATAPVTDDGVGRVIVVGAGPAGMSAAALLRRAGVDVRVLEARPTYGGRIRQDVDFTDFPIPLGGEWLHESPRELARIAQVPAGELDVELAAYQPDDEVAYYDGALTTTTMSDDPDTDLKFVGQTWLGFFETELLPQIADVIDYGVEIVRVAETADGVVLTAADGTTHEAERTIVTVPLKLLQDGAIEFDPPLPEAHREAIERAEIWGGMKVFLEFSDRFYPVFLAFPDSDTPAGQRLYYDAAYGQDTEANILGLFSVGRPAERYQAVDDGDELRDLILAELDEVFDGAASRTYVQHVAKNWNDEPFARAAYLADEADWRIPPRLQERFSERILLAGDAYTSHDDWSAVDDAARSGREAADELLA